MKTLIILALGLIFCCAKMHAEKPKNIVIIMADDLGFNDLSLRGSNEIPTPNIDALAYNGILMNRFYTPPLCTPSRASLLTGRYPFHIGLQNNVAWNDEPHGLGLDQKLMSEFFKEAGYSTHLVGKWHLGFYRQQYTPTRRGFDTFFGYYGPWTDYFDHSFEFFEKGKNYSRGLDLRRNFEVDRSHKGEYATDMYTKEAISVIENHDKDKPMFMILAHLAPHAGNDDFPLQAKSEDIEKFSYIENEERRIYAAMVHSLDESVGKVVESLTKTGMMEDTIVIFYSDNGGPTSFKVIHPTTANNYPLKGQKGWDWEGGIRTDCVIYAPFLPSGVIRNDLFHVVDFLPTLSSLAGADIYIDRKIDGIDQSKMIRKGKAGKRETVVTIDNIYGISSVIKNNYKFVNGTFVPLQGLPDNWLGQNNYSDYEQEKYVDKVLSSKTAQILKKFNKLDKDTIEKFRESAKVKCLGKKTPCNLLEKPCLFDIDNDPCEEFNLATDENLALVLEAINKNFNENLITAVPTLNSHPDARSDPALHDGVWTWWLPDLETFNQTSFGEYAIVYPKEEQDEGLLSKKKKIQKCYPVNKKM